MEELSLREGASTSMKMTMRMIPHAVALWIVD